MSNYCDKTIGGDHLWGELQVLRKTRRSSKQANGSEISFPLVAKVDKCLACGLIDYSSLTEEELNDLRAE